ncbi:Zinc-type alcohol dehydrogenase-like protein [Paramyrothecium foliicola]|nr:Zinc-type alcohol dehydrogenase-like protein [Paramyrothecium foliicola]
MHAILFTNTTGGIENNLALQRDVADLVLPTNERAALVEVLHSSINPQDYKIAELALLGSIVIKRPATPGTDFVGQIKENSLPGFEPGDLVFGTLNLPIQHGTLAQLVVIRAADGLVKVPKEYIDRNLDLRLLACLGTAGLTAIQCFQGLAKRAHVFINGGSGGTGTFCIQIARNAFSAQRIVVTTSSTNTDLVKRLGAHEAIDYRNEDVVERLVKAASIQGCKFDLVIDNVGNRDDLYWQSDRFLKREGKFIRIGAPHVGLSFAVNLVRLSLGSKTPWSKRAPFQMLFVRTESDHLETMAHWILEGKVVPGRQSGSIHPCHVPTKRCSRSFQTAEERTSSWQTCY